MPDVGTLLNTLRSPSGVDFYPVVIQVLMVLTWAVHMFFINLVIGSMFLTIYGYFQKDLRWRHLSQKLIKIAIISLSLGIVFGVAPLLFTQTIYDNLWYTANNLSASWVVTFVPVVIVAYYAAYFFYFRNKDRSPVWLGVFPIISLLLILLAGSIMHIFSYQELFPDKWIDWYTNGGTTMNTDGWHVYAFSIPRFLMFIFLSFFVTGIFLKGYAWFFGKRTDMDQDEVTWFGTVGHKVAIVSGGLLIADAILYNILQGTMMHPVIWGTIGFVAVVWALLIAWGNRKMSWTAPTLVILAGLSDLSIGIMREAIRMIELAQYNHTIYDYPLNMDIFGPIFFFGTLAVGIAIFTFVLYVLYKGGRVAGVYEASKVETANTAWRMAWYAVVMWLIVFWGTGVIVLSQLNNY
ncbi:MAG: hypothetical protein IMX04_05870 [Candidatus Carbobacillus altaicus]|uniref:Uncharacterized protein n=1 Tax=Candidatus Carbonibacillus altaicus TaxID=2163959 RepID=A0A2R6Y2B3_9BACL|nr:hypothetical protein [Candidatus Carbobacillus altaicus]PTQ56830.1 MAG: hypothetical protein BSOLF_2632 [Candidatus Carbobacillus altaicus]